MADRYWVGGSGTWNTTNTAPWSDTSGGTGGFSAPTSADNVFIDANSNVGTGAFTITTSSAVCADLTISGLDGTATFNLSSSLYVYGNVNIQSTNVVQSVVGYFFFRPPTGTTKTLNYNGGTGFSGNLRHYFEGPGEIKLASDIGSSNAIYISGGNFTTDNFNISTGFYSIYSNAKVINLGSSTLTGTSTSGSSWSYSPSAATLNAGTSTIRAAYGFTSTTAGDYYNVEIYGTSRSIGRSINCAGTIANNLTIAAPSANGPYVFSVSSNLTINGTLISTPSTSYLRTEIRSDTLGTSRTITAGTVNISNTDFRDITGAGAATWSGTRIGDCGGNSGITFDSKTVYCVTTASANWEANIWALTSNGTPSTDNFPLAQDTIIFDDAGMGTGITITTNSNWNVGNINSTSKTENWSVSTGGSNGPPRFYGDFELSATTAWTSGNITTFGKRNTLTKMNIPSSAIQLAIEAFSGTVQLSGNCTLTGTNGILNFYRGTLDLNGYTYTANRTVSSGNVSRTLAFNGGKMVFTGNNTTIINYTQGTGFAVTGTPRVELTYSGATGTRTVTVDSSYAATNKVLDIYITAGTDIVTLTSTLYAGTIDFTGFSGTLSGTGRYLYRDLVLSPTMTCNSTTSNTLFLGLNSQTFTTNNTTYPCNIYKQGTETLSINGNLNMSSANTMEIYSGGLSLNGNSITNIGTFTAYNSINTRNINLGTNGLIEAVTTIDFRPNTGLTFSGTGTLRLKSNSAKTFQGGNRTYPYTLDQNGTGTLTITGNNTLYDINNSDRVASTIVFPNSTTTVSNFSAKGAEGNLLTLSRTGASGTFTLAKSTAGIVESEYLSISNSTATPANTWYAGSTSTNGGGNTGWLFTDYVISSGSEKFFLFF